MKALYSANSQKDSMGLTLSWKTHDFFPSNIKSFQQKGPNSNRNITMQEPKVEHFSLFYATYTKHFELLSFSMNVRASM